jgi:ketol-acid reductoisomerase
MKKIELIGIGIEVTPEEANLLLDLFQHKGWAVLQGVRAIEKEAAMISGMALQGDETNRAMNRAVFHKLLADEQFPSVVRESVKAYMEDEARQKK